MNIENEENEIPNLKYLNIRNNKIDSLEEI